MAELYVHKGPMFAGKTCSLIENLEEYDNAVAIKPAVDDRYSECEIVSHDGDTYSAEVVDEDDLYKTILEISDEMDAIGVDEAQFFDVRLQHAYHDIRNKDLDVFVYGLNKDFRGESFDTMDAMEDVADEVVKHYADCEVCGGDAGYTQRLVDGEPADYDDPTFLVAGSDKYEARCEEHHII